MHIALANKYADYRKAVLSFNQFTPTVLDWPKVAKDLSAVQARIQNSRFLNEKKERDGLRTLAEKFEKAVADADRQQKDFQVIFPYMRDKAEWKPAYTYSELLPEVRAETDKDQYAFTPFLVKDRKNRPPATPHPDAKKSIPPNPKPSPSPDKSAPVKDLFQLNSVWVSDAPKRVLTVLERKGDTFRAKFLIGAIERDVTGTVKNGKISWLAKDVRAYKGGPGGDNDGTIQGGTIEFVWRDNSGQSGKFTLRLSKTP
jgi:hypothetical protein